MWRASTLPSQFWFPLQWCWCSSWSFSSAFPCKFRWQRKGLGAYCFGVCFSLIRFCLCRAQSKTLQLPGSSSPPYDNMTEESAFDNPVYETGVSMDAMNLRDVGSHNTIVLSWSILPAILSFHLSSVTLTWSAEQIKRIRTVRWLNRKTVTYPFHLKTSIYNAAESPCNGATNEFRTRYIIKLSS